MMSGGVLHGIVGDDGVLYVGDSGTDADTDEEEEESNGEESDNDSSSSSSSSVHSSSSSSSSTSSPTAPPNQTVDFADLKVVQLRAELGRRGLPVKGLKKELIKRLKEHVAARS